MKKTSSWLTKQPWQLLLKLMMRSWKEPEMQEEILYISVQFVQLHFNV